MIYWDRREGAPSLSDLEEGVSPGLPLTSRTRWEGYTLPGPGPHLSLTVRNRDGVGAWSVYLGMLMEGCLVSTFFIANTPNN